MRCSCCEEAKTLRRRPWSTKAKADVQIHAEEVRSLRVKRTRFRHADSQVKLHRSQKRGRGNDGSHSTYGNRVTQRISEGWQSREGVADAPAAAASQTVLTLRTKGRRQQRRRVSKPAEKKVLLFAEKSSVEVSYAG